VTPAQRAVHQASEGDGGKEDDANQEARPPHSKELAQASTRTQ